MIRGAQPWPVWSRVDGKISKCVSWLAAESIGVADEPLGNQLEIATCFSCMVGFRAWLPGGGLLSDWD